ncbi:MAG: choice-of-anchor L domain-containing protein, partial [Flavobacteriaceae bacterium]|nr:choice-of-anchor L domain-containing protein [Flavobacteriaceae bacterium]
MKLYSFRVDELKGIQHSYYAFLSTTILSLIFVASSFGQATFTSGSTAATLAAQMAGPGITISNPTITTGISTQAGIFSNGVAGANLQLDTGIALTTGSISNTFSTNTSTSSVDVAGGAYTDAEISSLISGGTINDLIIFEFDAVLDPLATVLTIDYQFMSDEYDEYVCSTYNDVFGYFITSDIIAPHTGYQNFAIVPGTSNSVAINSVNNGSIGANGSAANCIDLTNSSQFISNNVGSTTVTVEYDGMTKKLRASAKNLIPGTTYHVKLALADISDSGFDSAILINLISGFPDDDDDGVANDVDIDDDNDGILDTVEDANLDNDNNPLSDPTDTDGDGIPNHLDLDSDGDGIPDNIEAQSTNGYIAPAGSFSANGVNTAYGGGLTPINTDGAMDGADYLDTDADNDGIIDTTEAGITLTGSVGSNGLDNGLESIDDYSDVNGTLNDPTTLPDTDGDVGSGGDVDYRDTISVGDIDGDGVPDTEDWDDDNDGITDAQELCNTDFTIVVSSTINVYIDLGEYENEDSWTLTGPGGFSESGGTYLDGDDIIDLNFPVTTAGTYVFTINDSQSDGLDGAGGSNENATSLYRISLDGSTIYESGTFPVFTSEVRNIEVTGTPSFSCLTSDPNADDDTDNTPNYADSDWATLNGTTIVNGVAASLDFDGDGIINSMDLDSDGDGIPDNIEAQPTNTYVSPNASVGATGILTNYGTGLTSIVNTDGTDLADYKDTDADDEGANDTTEAGLTLNGVLGANGLDSAIYTTTNYSDVNGTINDPTTLPDSDSDLATTGDVDYRDDTNDVSIGSGNTLWLRADIGVVGSSNVTLWYDQSDFNDDDNFTNDSNFTGTGGTTPDATANYLNFNPVVTFTPGNSDVLSFTGNLDPRTMYIVYSDTSTASWTTGFTNNDGSGIGHGHSDDTQIFNNTFNISDVLNGSQYVNGLSTTLISHARPDNFEIQSRIFLSNVSNASHTYYIGRDRTQTTRTINGSVAEVLLFTDAHDDATRQKIEGYLALKYGFTLNSTDDSGSIIEGDYILSNGVTKVWDYTANSAYHNDVAGIGRDDTQVLNQKQSKSVNSDAIITLGLGSIAANNA